MSEPLPIEITADIISMLLYEYDQKIYDRFHKIPGPERRERLNGLTPLVLEYIAQLFKAATH